MYVIPCSYIGISRHLSKQRKKEKGRGAREEELMGIRLSCHPLDRGMPWSITIALLLLDCTGCTSRGCTAYQPFPECKGDGRRDPSRTLAKCAKVDAPVSIRSQHQISVIKPLQKSEAFDGIIGQAWARQEQ